MSFLPPQPKPAFPDLQQVTAALERAAQRARQIAEQTGTELIVGKPSKWPDEQAPKPVSKQRPA